MDNIYQFFCLDTKNKCYKCYNLLFQPLFSCPFSPCPFYAFYQLLSAEKWHIKKFLRNFAQKKPPKNVKTQRQNKTMFDRFCITQQKHLKLKGKTKQHSV